MINKVISDTLNKIITTLLRSFFFLFSLFCISQQIQSESVWRQINRLTKRKRWLLYASNKKMNNNNSFMIKHVRTLFMFICLLSSSFYAIAPNATRCYVKTNCALIYACNFPCCIESHIDFRKDNVYIIRSLHINRRFAILQCRLVQECCSFINVIIIHWQTWLEEITYVPWTAIYILALREKLFDIL